MQRTVDSFIERISRRGEVPLASVELEKLIGMKFSTLDEEADAVITAITLLRYLRWSHSEKSVEDQKRVTGWDSNMWMRLLEVQWVRSGLEKLEPKWEKPRYWSFDVGSIGMT